MHKNFGKTQDSNLKDLSQKDTNQKDLLPGIWKIAVSQIRLNISEKNYQIWFSKTRLVDISGGIAKISCPNSFTSDYINLNYLNITRKALSDAYGSPVDITLVVKKGDAVENTPLFEINTKDSITKDVLKKETEVSHDSSLIKAGLNPKYSLKNFIVGSSNRLAHAAACAIIDKPGEIYNPFFVFGGVGLGKTHLMQAIGNSILEKNPDYKVAYVSSETFLNELINSIKKGKSENFRKQYRENDVLIIDDIQFISGRKGTQEEFFHTFNTLHQANKQIILASDRHPRDIENLEERLVSRFEGGMVADISLPDEETRVAILRKKCEERGIKVNDEVLSMIAISIESNIRELEGVLTKVIALQTSLNKELTPEDISKYIGISRKRRQKRLRPKDVIDSICEKYEVSRKDIFGERRTVKVVLPRQIAMYILRTDLNLSLVEVASILKRKDHTTIMHGVDKIENLIGVDLQIKDQIAEIRHQL